MKNYKIIGVTLFIILTSCSIKSKQKPNNTSNLLEERKALPDSDSDNDGISDVLERQTGTNPFIADIPKISISFVQDISIGAIFKTQDNFSTSNKFSTLSQEFFETESTKAGNVDSLKILRKKIVRNQYNHLRNIKTEKVDLINNEDLRTNILSSWSDSQFYPFLDSIVNLDDREDNVSGKFSANFKIQIRDAKNVSDLSNMSLKSFFFDYEDMSESEIYNHYLLKSSGSKERFTLKGNDSYLPVTIFPLIVNELKSNDVFSKLVNRSEIGIKFTDYSYTTLGIQQNYSEVLSKVFDGDAKVIFSDGVKTDVYFVSPSISLGEALAQVGKKIVFNKDGEIYSINEIETTAKYPIDIDKLTIDDLKKGIWSVFGDADNLSDQLKAQGQYVVAYSKIEDILSVSRKWTNITEDPIVEKLKIENVYNGDEILLDIKDLSLISSSESITQVVYGEICTGSACNFVEDINRDPECRCKAGCTVINSTPIVVNSSIELVTKDLNNWFSFENEFGEKITANIFKYGSKLIIKFNDLKSHLKNNITIKIRNPNNLKSSARRGRVGGTCGGIGFSVEDYTNKLKINGSVKIFGINKY
jgi:hypothetical protein